MNKPRRRKGNPLLLVCLLIVLSACGGGKRSNGGIPSTHSVQLQWDASTSSNVVGYNVYRGSRSGGPYLRLNASLITGLSFTDATVQSGQTYFYVTTSVDSSQVESLFSNEVSAIIPDP